MGKIIGLKEQFFEKMRHYCAYQDRCQQEVIFKMRTLKIDPEWQDEIILSLIQEDFLNEERFVRSVVRGKFNQKSWGKLKIKQFLIQKNITNNLIHRSLSEIDDSSYLNKILQLIEKKKTQLENEGIKQTKSLVVSYLIQKGYEPELVYKCLSVE